MRRALTVPMAAACVALASAACQEPSPQGYVELRWVLPAAGTGGLAGISLTPSWAGAGRGRTREEGWREIPLTRSGVGGVIRFPTPGERPVSIAIGALPAGHYDRVYVAVSAVYGFTASGSRVLVANHVEPIARGFDLAPGGTVTVDIELVVLPRVGSAAPSWQLFVKDARLAWLGLPTQVALSRGPRTDTAWAQEAARPPRSAADGVDGVRALPAATPRVIAVASRH